MPKKVFVDEPNEENVEMVVEAPKPKKPRKKRAPLTPEQKQALVERLAKARLAKKNAKKPVVEKPVVEKPVVEKPKRKPRAKPTPKELDQARSRTNKTVAKVEPINEPITQSKEIIVEDEPTINEVEPIIQNTPPPPPQSRTRNIANSGNIWNMIRNS